MSSYYFLAMFLEAHTIFRLFNINTLVAQQLEKNNTFHVTMLCYKLDWHNSSCNLFSLSS